MGTRKEKLGMKGRKRMNRAVRKLHQRRCALKNTRGGGLNVNPGAFFTTSNGVHIPENQRYDDCYSQLRPGELVTVPRPDLAQTAMAGGRRSRTRRMRAGACGCMRGGACPCMMQRGGTCGLMRRTRRMRGGRYSVDPSINIGGDGPIAAPANVPVPCDARAGAGNPFNPTLLGADPRAPANLYSLTPNTMGGMKGGAYMETRIPNFDYHTTQAGGSYGGNAYDPSCYRAPGSQMPVYPAESAGFHFTPSTAAGAALPDGVPAYNEVVPYAARMGGARRRTRRRKANKKSRKHRKY